MCSCSGPHGRSGGVDHCHAIVPSQVQEAESRLQRPSGVKIRRGLVGISSRILPVLGTRAIGLQRPSVGQRRLLVSHEAGSSSGLLASALRNLLDSTSRPRVVALKLPLKAPKLQRLGPFGWYFAMTPTRPRSASTTTSVRFMSMLLAVHGDCVSSRDFAFASRRSSALGVTLFKLDTETSARPSGSVVI
jgi:hypothetical protein